MKQIFFATKNKDKINKMKNRLKELQIEVITPYDFDCSNINVEENGKTVVENATLKAKKYFQTVKIPTVATDSALYVEKFQTQPGLFVHRINGIDMKDDNLEQYYKEELKKVGGSSNAYYVTGIALIQDENIVTSEIKEDTFLFTANQSKNERNYDPLSRLEYDETSKKYFCEFSYEELSSRQYTFDTEVKKFIKNNLR